MQRFIFRAEGEAERAVLWITARWVGVSLPLSPAAPYKSRSVMETPSHRSSLLRRGDERTDREIQPGHEADGALHDFSVLGLPAASCTAKVPVPRPGDLRPAAVRPVSSWNSREASLHRRHAHGVPALSGEALCRELALGGLMPILHLGTPVSNTVCERCPDGHFSAGGSSTEPCQPHRNCSDLGLKTLRWGTSTSDSLCGKRPPLECSQPHTVCHTDVTLCEEAVFQSIASLRLSSVPLERLLESLPGRRVDRKSVERLKKACSPQQQVLQLLRLWREQNKDQDKLYGIIQGVNHCERKVSRCNNLKNLTLDDLLKVTNSLPGVKVQEEDVQAVVSSCLPRQYILQVLHLWKTANHNLDLAKGLSHSLRVLRSQGAPRYLLKGLKTIIRIIGTTSAHKMYEKMFVSMLQDESCFKAHKPLNE
uniref:TNF receptor superfamily member 11b n=1 Tax=Amphiprion ocellaris TaxID=80972 RepID=A0AAQ6A547_AMPOC